MKLSSRLRLDRNTIGCELEDEQELQAGKQESTVHHQRLACNVGTFFRSKQQRKFCDVRWLPEALNGLLAEHGISLRFPLPVIFAERGLNITGSDCIHTHALGP